MNTCFPNYAPSIAKLCSQRARRNIWALKGWLMPPERILEEDRDCGTTKSSRRIKRGRCRYSNWWQINYKEFKCKIVHRLLVMGHRINRQSLTRVPSRGTTDFCWICNLLSREEPKPAWVLQHIIGLLNVKVSKRWAAWQLLYLCPNPSFAPLRVQASAAANNADPNLKCAKKTISPRWSLLSPSSAKRMPSSSTG